MLDRSAKLVCAAGEVCDEAERSAALELRPSHRTTDEPVVQLLRDARDRPGQRGDAALETDPDGAELHGGYEQRTAARRQHGAVHELEVHQPLTSVLGRACDARPERELQTTDTTKAELTDRHPLDLLWRRRDIKHHEQPISRCEWQPVKLWKQRQQQRHTRIDH